MRSKIFNPAILAFMALMAISNISFAQDETITSTDSVSQSVTSGEIAVSPVVTIDPVTVNLNQVKVKLRKIKVDLKGLNATTNTQVTVALNNLTADLNADLKEIAPQINLAFKEGTENSSYDNKDDDVNLVKNYSKTYSVDGNDALSINNKYGKVVVNTWARNEVKVDVQSLYYLWP